MTVYSQTFLVRKSNTRQCQTLCVRLPEATGPSFVSSHYIQESSDGKRDWPGRKGLQMGGWTFPGLTSLIPQASPWRARTSRSPTLSSSSVLTATPGESAHRPCSPGQPVLPPHCEVPPPDSAPLSGLRDILLLPLRLPRAIHQAATHKELEAISHLGMGKGSPATCCRWTS